MIKKRLIIFGVIFISIVFAMSGCEKFSFNRAGRIAKAYYYTNKGEQYLKDAIQIYNGLINDTASVQERDKFRYAVGKLYMRMGNYAKAIERFRDNQVPEAKKQLAIAYYKDARYSDALALFENLGELTDNEYLFYYGQALEKNNLFDKALSIYARIPAGATTFDSARGRVGAIKLAEESDIDPQVKALLQQAPSQEQHPQAGALILRVEERYEVFPDATAEYSLHYIIKILNERGKEDFSEVKIGYDSTFEDVEIEYARTIKPDGTIVYVGDRNIRDVSIYLNFPLYSNARARIISMPEVTEGAIIEYKAKKRYKQLVNKKDFFLTYTVQEAEPVKSAVFSVVMPGTTNFNYKVINDEYNTFGAKLDPAILVENTKKVYSWQMNDIPEIMPEPNMPPTAYINPIIVMSSFQSWDDIYRWWYDLYSDKIAVNEAIQAAIDLRIKGKERLEEKLRSLYNFCTQEIRYVAVEYGQAGYEPHRAADIFQNKYGDCKDKAILLVAMLRAIGIKAFPVLIGTYGSLNLLEDFPTLVFNHCIVVAEANGEFIFMDPTAQTVSLRDLPSGDCGRLVFAIFDDTYRIMATPQFSANHNSRTTSLSINISPDESITGARSVSTEGIFKHSQRYWLKFTKPKFIEESLRSKVQDMATGAELTGYQYSGGDSLDLDPILEYEFQAPEFFSKAGKYRLIPQLGSIDISPIARLERRYPIEYPVLAESIEKTRFQLPATLTVMYLPEDIDITSTWFDFVNKYSYRGDTVTFYQVYRLKERVVRLKDYDAYKKLLEEISRKTKQSILLKEQ